jgi:hypothetical protein
MLFLISVKLTSCGASDNTLWLKLWAELWALCVKFLFLSPPTSRLIFTPDTIDLMNTI